jgi:hypothetical protein
MPGAKRLCRHEAKRTAMKNRKHERLALAKIGGCWLRKMIALAKALRYGRAAQRDERNGFHYTAAIEWRHAAELFRSGSLAAEYCWRQWERIMHSPRPTSGTVQHFSTCHRFAEPRFSTACAESDSTGNCSIRSEPPIAT